MAVTKEQIFSAADELAASGQRPTLEAIRKITGGSYTTISPALNEWKARQVTAAAPLREPAPQAVADRLAELEHGGLRPRRHACQPGSPLHEAAAPSPPPARAR